MFLFILSCADKPNSLKDHNLNDNVLKVYYNTYDAVEKSGSWVIGEKSYYGGNYVFIFNDDGFLTEYSSFDSYNVLNERGVNSLDENNFSTKQTYFNKDGSITSTAIYHYGSWNRLTKVVFYNSDAKIEYSNSFEYSLFNKVSIIKRVNVNNSISSITKNKWSGSFLKSVIYCDSTGKVLDKYAYFDNKYNDIVKISILDANDKVINTIKYSYEYDDHDNWIKRTQFGDSGNPTSFTVRRIIYKSKNGNKLNADELVCIWNEVDDNDWIEFKKDGTYDLGYNDKITDYGKWELNEEQKTLTLKSNEEGSSKKFSYDYKNQTLSLSSLDGSDSTFYEKR